MRPLRKYSQVVPPPMSSHVRAAASLSELSEFAMHSITQYGPCAVLPSCESGESNDWREGGALRSRADCRSDSLACSTAV